jgi:hypothetical protein
VTTATPIKGILTVTCVSDFTTPLVLTNITVTSAQLGVLLSVANTDLSLGVNHFEFIITPVTGDTITIDTDSFASSSDHFTGTNTAVFTCQNVVGNTVQNAHTACGGGCAGPGGDGTVGANTYYLPTLAEANALALSIAQSIADSNATDPSNCCCDGTLPGKDWNIVGSGGGGFFSVSDSGNGFVGTGDMLMTISTGSPSGVHIDYDVEWCDNPNPTITVTVDWNLHITANDEFRADCFIEVYGVINGATPPGSVTEFDFSAMAAGDYSGSTVCTVSKNAAQNSMNARLSIGSRGAGAELSGTITIS